MIYQISRRCISLRTASVNKGGGFGFFCLKIASRLIVHGDSEGNFSARGSDPAPAHQVGAGRSAVFTSPEYRRLEVFSPSMRNSLQFWALQESNVAGIARIGVRDFHFDSRTLV